MLLSERPDGRGMSMQVTLPGGSVDNEGRLIADGGTIAMHAQVVNQNGFIQANSVQNVNGVIELVASDQLTLGANSQIIASGDNSPAGSAGGNVTLQIRQQISATALAVKSPSPAARKAATAATSKSARRMFSR